MTIRPLYSSGQVAAATFFGGVTGGGWLLALNYQRLGEPRKARLVVGLSLLTMAIMCAIAYLLPVPTSLISIGGTIAMASIAKALQGETYERHIALQGQRGSNWRAIGVGIASLAIWVAVLFGIGVGYAVLSEPDEVVFGEFSVRYTDGGTQAEAQAVGDSLIALGAFTRDTVATVEVRHDAAAHLVAFVVQGDAASSERIQTAYHRLADQLSRRAFAGEAVDIWLTDETLSPQTKLLWNARPRTPAEPQDETPDRP